MFYSVGSITLQAMIWHYMNVKCSYSIYTHYIPLSSTQYIPVTLDHSTDFNAEMQGLGLPYTPAVRMYTHAVTCIALADSTWYTLRDDNSWHGGYLQLVTMHQSFAELRSSDRYTQLWLEKERNAHKNWDKIAYLTRACKSISTEPCMPDRHARSRRWRLSFFILQFSVYPCTASYFSVLEVFLRDFLYPRVPEIMKL